MNVLDIFSGIGGFSLGLERAGMRTVAFCEIDPFCRRVLAKHWPSVPIFHDVTQLRSADVGPIDVVCGGFPCQDISEAGSRRGIEGARSGLWTEFARIIGDIRPRFAIVENVSELLAGDDGRWMGRVLGDLASLGYNAEWHCIPAGAVGARHPRDRIWIIGFLPDATSIGFFQRWWQQFTESGDQARNLSQWTGEPEPPRVADGVSGRMDTVRTTGNAVVPQIPEIIGRAIMTTVSRS